MRYLCSILPSPVGPLQLIASQQGLAAILWEKSKSLAKFSEKKVTDNSPVLIETIKQLRAYFSGKLKQFDLPLDLQGTPFQKQVWQALLTVPYGKTAAYQEIAKQVGRPLAVRAVGTAIGKNPISIVVPCHRIIAKNGKLAGFAGGLSIKAALLELEEGGTQRYFI